MRASVRACMRVVVRLCVCGCLRARVSVVFACVCELVCVCVLWYGVGVRAYVSESTYVRACVRVPVCAGRVFACCAEKNLSLIHI